MQAYPQQNALALALQEYRRWIRTIHVLKWYANNDDRRRVMRQLNKGEALHDLRAYLMIANKGQLRRKRGDELVNQASCLNLITNAVILWNGSAHMTQDTCGKQVLPTSANRSRPGRSVTKADFFPKIRWPLALQVLEKQWSRFRGVGKNYFPYMSCVM
jgi:hypothetical protein